MAKSLIERLAGLENLTPDEIIKRIHNPFIRAATMTQEQFDSLANKPVAFYSTMFRNWEANSRRPNFRCRLGHSSDSDWRDYESFSRGFWSDWWLLAQSDYYEGISCPTSSSA